MIPFIDLKAQHKELRKEITQAIEKVFATNQFILGKEVEAFEEEFADYCGVRYAAGVNTGTSALHLSLLAAGIQAGDEVITVPNTFIATVAAIDYVGARPVFVDVDEKSLNMDMAQVENAISEKTKAIIPVHLHGQTVDMDPLTDIAAKHDLIVIEDACQAHGAEYKGNRAGSLGDIGCFSFYPGKNLGACGEGGMVVTDDESIISRVKQLRNWGQGERYYHEYKGFNYRMDGLQGAILRVKLRHLDKWTNCRREAAQFYSAYLDKFQLVLPFEASYAKHVYHVYAIRSTLRDKIQKALFDNAIQVGIHYPVPVHLQKSFQCLGYKNNDFPVSEKTSNQLLSLPIFPGITQAQLTQVGDTIGASLS